MVSSYRNFSQVNSPFNLTLCCINHDIFTLYYKSHTFFLESVHTTFILVDMDCLIGHLKLEFWKYHLDQIKEFS